MADIRFGTDGWRGLIARDFTFDNVALCAQGLANYLKRQGATGNGIVVGYDTRFASMEFAQCVAEVLSGNGVPVSLATEPAPTPTITYQIRSRHAAGAVIITASHNPPLWNGFKYKPNYAGSATSEITRALEDEINLARHSVVSSLPLVSGYDQGVVKNIDPAPSYLDHLRELVDTHSLSSAGLRIQIDAMYGSGSGYFPTLLNGLSTNVTEIHAEHNPAFPGIPQPEPIEKHLGQLSSAVLVNHADIGIALDGDGDRIGIMDEQGRFVSPLQIFAILALYLLETKGCKGTMVKSNNSTSMISRLGELYGVPVLETPVGFKHIAQVMIREDGLIGGEESGGFGFRGHIPERDGILSGLYFLDFMVRTGKRASELLNYLYSLVGPHHYQRLDVPFNQNDWTKIEKQLQTAEVAEIGGCQVTGTDHLDGWRFFLDKSWIILRRSGTEPLLRIYAEAESPEKVQRLLRGAVAYFGLDVEGS